MFVWAANSISLARKEFWVTAAADAVRRKKIFEHNRIARVDRCLRKEKRVVHHCRSKVFNTPWETREANSF